MFWGMPLGSSFKVIVVWNPIIEKMEQRLVVGKSYIYKKKVEY